MVNSAAGPRRLLLDGAMEKRYRKSNGWMYEPVFVDGVNTHAWRPQVGSEPRSVHPRAVQGASPALLSPAGSMTCPFQRSTVSPTPVQRERAYSSRLQEGRAGTSGGEEKRRGGCMGDGSRGRTAGSPE